MSTISDHSDSDTLSTAPTNITALSDNPFSKARGAKFPVPPKSKPKKPVSTLSVVTERAPHERTRNFSQRLGVVPAKPTPPAPKRQRSSTNLANSTPVYAPNEELNSEDEALLLDDEELPLKESTGTPAISLSTSRTSSISASMAEGASGDRKKRSTIYEHMTVKSVLGIERFHCHYCNNTYKFSGGTRVCRDHLLKEHRISSKNENEERRAVWDGDVAATLSRQPQADKERKERLAFEHITESLNKDHLMYLYLR